MLFVGYEFLSISKIYFLEVFINVEDDVVNDYLIDILFGGFNKSFDSSRDSIEYEKLFFVYNIGDVFVNIDNYSSFKVLVIFC